jgi:hypothetical protein
VAHGRRGEHAAKLAEYNALVGSRVMFDHRRGVIKDLDEQTDSTFRFFIRYDDHSFAPDIDEGDIHAAIAAAAAAGDAGAAAPAVPVEHEIIELSDSEDEPAGEDAPAPGGDNCPTGVKLGGAMHKLLTSREGPLVALKFREEDALSELIVNDDARVKAAYVAFHSGAGTRTQKLAVLCQAWKKLLARDAIDAAAAAQTAAAAAGA